MLHPLYWAALVPAACAGLLALGRYPRWKKAWLLICSAVFLAAVQPETWWLTLLLTALAWLAPLDGRRGAAAYAGLAILTLAAVKLIGWAWPVGLSFVALVYLYAWLDALYYKYNFPRICRRILDAFTEED